MASMALLSQITSKSADIVQALRGLRLYLYDLKDLVQHQQKNTPNQELVDQVEELIEVVEFLIERMSAHQTLLTLEKTEVSLGALLDLFTSIIGWLQANDLNLKSVWPPRQSSEAIEEQRTIILRGYSLMIPLCFLERHQDENDLKIALKSYYSHFLCRLDVARLTRVANFASPVTHHKVRTLVEKEKDQLREGVADFEGSEADGNLVQISKLFKEVADSKLQDQERARSLARLVSDNFTIGDNASTLYRRASASTIESPLEPHFQDNPTSPQGDRHSSAYTTSSSDAYSEFRPSFVPSISEFHEFDLDTPAAVTSRPLVNGHNPRAAGAGTASRTRSNASSQSNMTRLPYLDTRDLVAEGPASRLQRTSSHSGSAGTGGDRRSSGTSTSSSAFPTAIIAFNARDALTNDYLVDPVLGSDGLIHDRWCLIEGDKAMLEITKNISIVGEVIQLREAIHNAHPLRKEEFLRKRSAYRKAAVEACTNPDQDAMKSCLEQLTNILAWKPDDMEILTRRAVINYRLRQLSEAKEDLDKAVKTSAASSLVNIPNLDSLRYRALVLAEIRDVENALLDIEAVTAQTHNDPLVLSLRATIRAGKGDADSALADLDVVKKALESGGGSQSALADENRDLDLIAKGWAHSSLGDIEAAVNDFEMAQSLRIFDPYCVACLGISLVHWGLTLLARGQEEEGKDKLRQGIGELTSAVVVVSRNTSTGEELTMPSPNGAIDDELAAMTLSSYAYDPFFLRGMANFALSKFEEALEDFDVAQRVRPQIVKDTGEFHCVLAILQAETQQYDAATRNFDYAMALKPEERENYLAKRAQYGL